MKLSAIIILLTLPLLATQLMAGSAQILDAPTGFTTPNMLCVSNGTEYDHLFVVETTKLRQIEMLKPGQALCASSTTGGKISVFETADALEGCTRIKQAGKSDIMIKYAEFDRCEWGSHSQ